MVGVRVGVFFSLGMRRRGVGAGGSVHVADCGFPLVKRVGLGGFPLDSWKYRAVGAKFWVLHYG